MKTGPFAKCVIGIFCIAMSSGASEPGKLSKNDADVTAPQTPSRFATFSSMLEAVQDKGSGRQEIAICEWMQADPDPSISWSGTSCLVASHRRLGNFELAKAITASVAKKNPEKTALMEIWDGDTDSLSGNHESALNHYSRAVELDSKMAIGGREIGAIALRQSSRQLAALGRYSEAAQAERDILRRFNAKREQAEFTLATALLYEAMHHGLIQKMPLGELLHDHSCDSMSQGCLIEKTESLGSTDHRFFSGFQDLLFRVDGADLELLELSSSKALPVSAASSCIVYDANEGFTLPVPDNGTGGWNFLDVVSTTIRHPGKDMNTLIPGGSGGDQDCNYEFKSVAKGCVMDSSPQDWGSAIVAHYYPPFRIASQYGHANAIFHSVGAAVTKGQRLGKVGKVGTTAGSTCHLHHEIRENDHPDVNNANYYTVKTEKEVVDWYQEPVSYIKSHKEFSGIRWKDESSFTTTGTWTLISGIGNEDDHKVADSTVSTLTNYARYSFSPNASARYELWVFVPWSGGTGSAKWTVAKSTTPNSAIASGNVNQNGMKDQWALALSWPTQMNTTYIVQIATNTGSSTGGTKKIALDDIMLIRLP